MRLGLPAAKLWWEQVEGSLRVRWEWVGTERAEKARKAFFRYRDKSYSFTDCTSFVVMQELRLKEALTTDAIFARWDSSLCRVKRPLIQRRCLTKLVD